MIFRKCPIDISLPILFRCWLRPSVCLSVYLVSLSVCLSLFLHLRNAFHSRSFHAPLPSPPPQFPHRPKKRFIGCGCCDDRCLCCLLQLKSLPFPLLLPHSSTHVSPSPSSHPLSSFRLLRSVDLMLTVVNGNDDRHVTRVVPPLLRERRSLRVHVPDHLFIDSGRYA